MPPVPLSCPQSQLKGAGTLGKPLGIAVIPQQHLLCIGQSHQGGCGQHPSLTHTSAQDFPEAPGFFNEVLGPPN
jgi:hypothetical protein